MREYRQYIGGQWVGAARLFDDLDPYRGMAMARVPAGTGTDAAQLSAGRGTGPGEPEEVLRHGLEAWG